MARGLAYDINSSKHYEYTPHILHAYDIRATLGFINFSFSLKTFCKQN